ncbi:MAG: AAA family ATPase [Acidobacteriota bacterium]
MITQQKLNAVISESSNLALVLFDEIEKAAPSMTRLLLGVLDKATLRLGDNTSVNFERTLIFLTSNLGAGGDAEAFVAGLRV